MRSFRSSQSWPALAIAVLLGGCGDGRDDERPAGPAGQGGAPHVPAAVSGRRSPPPAAPSETLGDLTSTELGGYQLGRPLAPGETDPGAQSRTDPSHCNLMRAVVRDF